MSPVWHDGPLASLAPGDGPVAWSVDVRTDPGIPADPTDLADAARDGDGDGAARLARRRLARALLARRAGWAPETVTIVRDAFGAPRLASPAGWHVSLSGRGTRALIGIARVAIGVDREPLRGDDVLWDMMTPAETATVRALPVAARPAAWLMRWTIKEAHAKLVGEPRRIAPQMIETEIDNDRRGAAAFEGRSETWTRAAHGGLETIAMWDRADEPVLTLPTA